MPEIHWSLVLAKEDNYSEKSGPTNSRGKKGTELECDVIFYTTQSPAQEPVPPMSEIQIQTKTPLTRVVIQKMMASIKGPASNERENRRRRARPKHKKGARRQNDYNGELPQSSPPSLVS